MSKEKGFSHSARPCVVACDEFEKIFS